MVYSSSRQRRGEEEYKDVCQNSLFLEASEHGVTVVHSDSAKLISPRKLLWGFFWPWVLLRGF